jgi:hypothetical protein
MASGTQLSTVAGSYPVRWDGEVDLAVSRRHWLLHVTLVGSGLPR